MKHKKAKSVTLKGTAAGFISMSILRRMGILICRLMIGIGRKRADYIYKAADYIRASSLELAAYEIYEKGISGNAAELGVYRGDYAKLINEAFPDRKLYLFDTFEGFNEKDVKKEKGTAEIQDFSNTDEELVLGKMKHRENCAVRKGYFPETAEGLEERFVFVSIDADLYEPIYKGLCYFYPRLAGGGYIFVHDYNDGKKYTGVKEAVRRYCKEQGIGYFPLSDNQGSAVIMK